ncbi:hypothetical protein UPYG_G00072180 [Umbra pygmaea]|uniref:Uncharacterized protein n=1 Tax=Umbra pygmaea TaxID=75934 RepID=A0ABD0XBW4_UMBPY
MLIAFEVQLMVFLRFSLRPQHNEGPYMQTESGPGTCPLQLLSSPCLLQQRASLWTLPQHCATGVLLNLAAGELHTAVPGRLSGAVRPPAEPPPWDR